MASPHSNILVTVLLSLSIFLYHTSATCHVDDHSALLSFKSGITRDPSGMLGSWVPTTDCCTWLGVYCGLNKRVNMLSVYGLVDNPDSYVSGTLSNSLSKLRYLNGTYIQNLRNLTGSFPIFLKNLPDLIHVSMDNNMLSGPIPSDVGTGFSKLEDLSLSRNRFSGSIPSSLSQLISLTGLDFGGNELTGSIPDEIRQLRNLAYLILEKNKLSGVIPNFFDSFWNLHSVKLSYNMFSGEIPSSILSLAPNLVYFEMGNNLLTGKIPEFIGSFSELSTLDLSANQLSGTVPSSLKSLTKIYNLNLARNKFIGTFPKMNVEGLETVDLSYNKFKLGQIPKWAGASFMVYSLKLAGCGLDFKLDTFQPIGNLHEFIDLSDNQISGSPIKLLNQTTRLKEFVASGNRLRFNISELVIPETLKYLNLSGNQVYGKIPASIARLEKLDLSNNRLCGQIPKNKFPATVFKGNACLCGSPLSACKK